jgi:pyrroline-5-carboxylate reductase
MAEGLLRSFDSGLEVFSAGTEPAAVVHPLAVRVMAELGIDISQAKPKQADQFSSDNFDYVITVCDHANETCPAFLGYVRHRLHIGFEDPAAVTGSEDLILAEFRRVRDEIKQKFYDLYLHQIVEEIAMSNKSWGFIGAGRVTKIILEGFKRAGHPENKIIAYDINPDVLAELQRQFPYVKKAPFPAEVAKQDYVFLALHPPAMNAGLEAIKSDLNKEAIVISLAPKYSIEKLTAGLDGFNRAARWLPNAATFLGRGHNPCAFSSSLSPNELAELTSLFSSVGDCVRVAEEKIEAYATIIAMGPTYFWFQWQKLFELGKDFGLSDDELKAGIPTMLHGAVQTYFESGLTPEQVIDLIPVKPLAEDEAAIKAAMQNKLTGLFQKLRG